MNLSIIFLLTYFNNFEIYCKEHYFFFYPYPYDKHKVLIYSWNIFGRLILEIKYKNWYTKIVKTYLLS